MPTSGAEIPPDWWKFLVDLDPDIIYSFLPLESALIHRINRHILPVMIHEVTAKDRERPGGHHISPHDIRALEIEDIPHSVWHARGSTGDPFFYYIKDSRGDTPHESSILRNFGVLPGTISMDTAFRDVTHQTLEVKDVQINDLFGDLLNRQRAVFPIDLCMMHASSPWQFSHDVFGRGFHLVIGDDPLDAMYAWNRALISERSLGRTTFWLSRELSRNEDLLKGLAEWLTYVYWDWNHRQGKVVSYSVEEAELKSIADRVRGIANFGCDFKKLDYPSFPCPSKSPIVPSLDSHTDQVSLSEGKGIISIPRPPFLIRGHPQFGWMVDLKIQYHPERYAPFTSIRPNWDLPKRLGLASGFFEGARGCRIVNGRPSTEVVAGENNLGIRIPSDREIFLIYFQRDFTNTGSRHARPHSRFRDFETSEKGQYLLGVLRLFDNLFHAYHAFEDPFWRDIFMRLAEADRPNREKQAVEMLQQAVIAHPEGLSASSSILGKLAEDLTKRLSLPETGFTVVTKKTLNDRFCQLRSEAQNTGLSHHWLPGENFENRAEAYLRQYLESSVLLQGVELVCPYCRSRQWNLVDDLASNIRCNGCVTLFSLPPNPEWSFRLNDLVRNALRRHGTLAVLRALYYIQQRSLYQHMFLFLPCQDIFERDPSNPNAWPGNLLTDLDLVVISDRMCIIGEVKSDPKGFKPDDFEKMKIVAEDLLPDEVVFAAPGDAWPSDQEAAIKQLAEALKPFEIKVTPILMSWN